MSITLEIKMLQIKISIEEQKTKKDENTLNKMYSELNQLKESARNTFNKKYWYQH